MTKIKEAVDRLLANFEGHFFSHQTDAVVREWNEARQMINPSTVGQLNTQAELWLDAVLTQIKQDHRIHYTDIIRYQLLRALKKSNSALWH